ncbi:uncharacterized protein TNCV_5118381 [Trichonephila clavipes]|nr:uncharacterized protein TNCV_5118381 [Trichonephila clavipes]
MDEQLKALLEGINALKNGQEETRRGQQEMQERIEEGQQEIQERMEKGQQEMQERIEKGQQEMQRSQEETKKGLENVQKRQEETKKDQEELKNSLKSKIDNVEEKINSVEERIAVKMEEMITVVEEKIEKKVGGEIEKSKEEVEERIERVAENFSLISQRMEDLEKKLLVGGNENKNKIVPVSAFPDPVLPSPMPATAFTGPVKLSTYDGKTNWEVYKTQFFIISEVNGWTEGVKACHLAASLRGEPAEILQTLPDTERLNLNSLYNALDIWFGHKYSKDYARL